jgi:hypothetical protein
MLHPLGIRDAEVHGLSTTYFFVAGICVHGLISANARTSDGLEEQDATTDSNLNAPRTLHTERRSCPDESNSVYPF